MENNIESNLYKKIIENVPISCVEVVIFDKTLEETLLFFRNNFPAKGTNYAIGGRLQKGETFVECAQRNLKKEIGVKIKKNKLFYVGAINEIFEDSIYKGVSTHNVVHYFASKLSKNQKIILDAQHSKFSWFDVKDKNLHPYMKEKIKRSLEYFINHGKK